MKPQEKTKNLKVAFFAFFLLFIFFLSFASLTSLATAQVKLEIGLPNISGNQFPIGQELPSYIRYLFIFGLGLITILALTQMIIGGITYILAAGNPAKVENAKDTIFQALLGVGILLISYLLLRTINPDLVNLRNPSLAPTQFQGANQNTNNLIKCGEGFCSEGYACINTPTGPGCVSTTIPGLPGAKPLLVDIPCGSGKCTAGSICFDSEKLGPVCVPPGTNPPSGAQVMISDKTFPMSQVSSKIVDPRLEQACKAAGRVVERAPTSAGGRGCITFCLAASESPRNPTCLD